MYIGEQPEGLLAICYLASAAPAWLQPVWPLQSQPSCRLISYNQPIRADSTLFKVSPPNTPCQNIVSQTSSVALSLGKGFSSSLLSLPELFPVLFCLALNLVLSCSALPSLSSSAPV
ncbi:hypothetical protein XELAEV_18033231mg [Xenopus laevis]|uniref:Uncharacterized protein n=1 Tax=Xenopus laevis TaxID=8355 RepID=A0A974CKF1_XENLA|nr:hypothetical protein XELAEV_18033231mg [Xenopus laevis]